MDSIKPWLQSDETGQAFTHCIHCKMPLLELDDAWLVNKDFHQGECTMEYAICQSCRNEVSEQLSEQSKLAVRDFLENEVPWEDRIAEFMDEPSPSYRFEHCVVCETNRSEAEGYATSILLDASGELVLGPLPLLICNRCNERVAERLSTATRDAWERFLNDHFAGPPQLSSLPGLL